VVDFQKVGWKNDMRRQIAILDWELINNEPFDNTLSHALKQPLLWERPAHLHIGPAGTKAQSWKVSVNLSLGWAASILVCNHQFHKSSKRMNPT
jgi:hypothetical protein